MKFPQSTKGRVILGIVVVALLAIIYIVVWGQSSAQGTITTQYYTKENQTQYKSLDGKTFSLQYDTRYAERILQPQNSNDIEDYMMVADTMYDKRLAISVARLPTGKLTDNSAYNLRFVHPELYQSKTQTIPAGSATVFTNTGGGEQDVFIVHKGMVASLAFTTTGANDNLTPEVAHTLSSFHWK